MIVYAGRPDENQAVAEVIKTPWLRGHRELFYPRAKLALMDVATPAGKANDPGKVNTLDQVKFFNLPGKLDTALGEQLGMVTHAPQAARTLSMMGAFPEAFPQASAVKMFTLPPPDGSVPEYPTMEIRGMVYYRFIANPPLVADAPYPYEV